MAEKEVTQRKVAAQDTEQQQEGKSMTPPAFQLMAGDAGDMGGGGATGTGAQVVQKQEAKKGQKAKVQTESQGEGYKIYTTKDSIVTIPDGATGSLPILMIYGGMSYAKKEWMKGQTPASFFSTHILAFANYTTYFTNFVKPDIETAMATAQVSGTYKALIGFSAGGYRVDGAMGDASWSILGMIDAVVTTGRSYPTTVLQIYNIWDGNTEKTDPRHLLHQRITNGDVKGESFRDKKHDSMPGKWFARYGSQL